MLSVMLSPRPVLSMIGVVHGMATSRWRQARTFGDGAWLAGDGARGPQLAQRVAEDGGEVVGVGGLVAASGQALLLQALQRRVGRQDGLPVQRPGALMLAVARLVNQLAAGVQHLAVYLHAVLPDLVPCKHACPSGQATGTLEEPCPAHGGALALRVDLNATIMQ